MPDSELLRAQIPFTHTSGTAGHLKMSCRFSLPLAPQIFLVQSSKAPAQKQVFAFFAKIQKPFGTFRNPIYFFGFFNIICMKIPNYSKRTNRISPQEFPPIPTKNQFCTGKKMSGMDFLKTLNTAINNVVWGPLMLTLLISAGLFLAVTTGWPQFTKFVYMLKNTIFQLFSKHQHAKDNAGVSPFQAVATAMAGTIGTGSIAGLATAIVSGGPGAVFWMWVSALLGMVTKYAEIVLSLKYREKDASGQWVGGPMYYIQNGLHNKWLAVLFAVFAMFACLGTGNATQSNSISVALESAVGIKPWITGLVLTVIAAAVILGGMRRIASVNEKLVPFMAVSYVACALIALILNFRAIPAAFQLIFKEAFNFKAATGGAAGYGITVAMHYGFSRGIFSNEAGLGSAPIAHAASSTKDPVKQGLWGMFEVFFTTIIICTLSALVILSSGLWDQGVYQGSALSIASFNKLLPGIGGVGVTLSTIFFALSTILGWAYYGEVSVGFLFNKSKTAILVYRCIYVAVVFIGTVGQLDLIWSISETMNGLMAIPNLIGVVGLCGIVRTITQEHFSKADTNKN